jgi:4-hydroxy-2-oxoheptanedioate aldolase
MKTEFRQKRLYDKLQKKETAYGFCLSSPSIYALETYGAKFDFCWIDWQHGGMRYEGLKGVEAAIMAAELSGLSLIVRVGSHSQAEVTPLIDLCPAGLIFPQVEDRTQAYELVYWYKFPPLGERSGGAGRSTRIYGADQDSLLELNKYTLLFAQIESKKGYDAMADIASLQGVDCLFLGPYDLSKSIGCAGAAIHKLPLRNYVEEFVAACREARKPCLIPAVTKEALEFVTALGVDMVNLGGHDKFAIMGAEQQLKMVNETRK